MEPEFIVKPSYTKEERKQFPKECWRLFENKPFFTGLRIVAVIYMAIILFVTLTRIIVVDNLWLWVIAAILGIMMAVFLPKWVSFKCIGIGINLIGNRMNRKVDEKIEFYNDHIDCLEHKNIQYLDMTMIEDENRLILKAERFYFLIKPLDLSSGTYNELIKFLHLVNSYNIFIA